MEWKKIKTITIILVLCFISCNSKIKQSNHNNREYYYNKNLKLYSQNLVSHFPVYNKIEFKIVSLFGLFTSDSIKLPMQLGIGLKYDSIEYFNIKKQCSNVAKNIFNVDDTNYLVALRNYQYLKEYNYILYSNYEDSIFEKKIIDKNLNNKNSNIVLPIFNSYVSITETTNNPIGLTKDFNIYLLETKKGVFVDKKYYSIDTSNNVMPERLKHGYSRGYALSDEQMKIIYWIVVW